MKKRLSSPRLVVERWKIVACSGLQWDGGAEECGSKSCARQGKVDLMGECRRSLAVRRIVQEKFQESRQEIVVSTGQCEEGEVGWSMWRVSGVSLVEVQYSLVRVRELRRIDEIRSKTSDRFVYIFVLTLRRLPNISSIRRNVKCMSISNLHTSNTDHPHEKTSSVQNN